MDYYRIHNWEQWQSYRRDRGQPPWIKVHRRLMRDPAWIDLSDAQQGQLVNLWMLAADKGGLIPADPAFLSKILHLDTPLDLGAFKDFIDIGATLTPERRQPDAAPTPQIRPETKTEEIKVEAKAEGGCDANNNGNGNGNGTLFDDEPVDGPNLHEQIFKDADRKSVV